MGEVMIAIKNGEKPEVAAQAWVDANWNVWKGCLQK